MYEHCSIQPTTSNDSSHYSSTPAAWFASGTAYHGRRYQNLGSWTSLRSYTIVDSIASILVVNGDREFTRLNPPSCRVDVELTRGQSDLHNVPRDRLTAHVELTRVNSTCLQRLYSYAKMSNSRDSDSVARDKPYH